MSTLLLCGVLATLAYGVVKAKASTYTIPYLNITVGPAAPKA